jgi:membrane protein DedA with SNARE-associated domain
MVVFSIAYFYLYLGHSVKNYNSFNKEYKNLFSPWNLGALYCVYLHSCIWFKKREMSKNPELELENVVHFS